MSAALGSSWRTFRSLSNAILLSSTWVGEPVGLHGWYVSVTSCFTDRTLVRVLYSIWLNDIWYLYNMIFYNCWNGLSDISHDQHHCWHLCNIPFHKEFAVTLIRKAKCQESNIEHVLSVNKEKSKISPAFSRFGLLLWCGFGRQMLWVPPDTVRVFFSKFTFCFADMQIRTFGVTVCSPMTGLEGHVVR